MVEEDGHNTSPGADENDVAPRGGAQRVRRHLERRAKHALQLAHPGHAVNRRLQPLPPWPRRASEHDLAQRTGEAEAPQEID